MALLFSKVDLNKLRHDVQNEEALICAKYGKDLFNISKVIGRKKWPNFLTHSVYIDGISMETLKLNAAPESRQNGTGLKLEHGAYILLESDRSQIDSLLQIHLSFPIACRHLLVDISPLTTSISRYSGQF